MAGAMPQFVSYPVVTCLVVFVVCVGNKHFVLLVYLQYAFYDCVMSEMSVFSRIFEGVDLAYGYFVVTHRSMSLNC
jgi:hypothetical protein